MKRSASLAVMATLCAAPAWAQQPTCQLKMVNSVPLTMVGNGRVALAPVTINGTKTNLLIDTGGVFTQLSAGAIDDLKLTVQDSGVKLLDLYGRAAEGSVRINSFVLGRLQAHDAPISWSALSGLPTAKYLSLACWPLISWGALTWNSISPTPR